MKWLGLVVWWVFFVVSGFGGCNGGSSSETVSFDEGSVEVTSTELALSGRTDAGNWVALYAADFLPHLDSGFADTLRADAHGRFAFTLMPAGTYHMLVRGSSDSLAAFLTEILWPSQGEALRTARLQPTAVLSGFISDSGLIHEGLVYIPGSPFYTRSDSLKNYTLGGLPSGEYRIRKTWLRTPPCMGLCTGSETRQDSTLLRLMPGDQVKW
jgi:hypothetical protein